MRIDKIDMQGILDTDIDTVGFGRFGVPNWPHWPVLPRCPKTNQKMKFILKMSTNFHRKLLTEISDEVDQFGESDLFFGDGGINVFFQPESKVVAYQAQY